MEAIIFKQKKEQNIELLILYQKLVDMQASCLTRLFRFEETQYFINFDKKYSVPNIINFRLDDLIYLGLLLIMQIIFGVLPMTTENIFTGPYRQSLALFFITSFIVLISPHWFRWVTLCIICIGYPILIYVTFNGYITLTQIDTSKSMFEYLGYLSLVPILVLLLLIYPVKQFIRNSVGAIYSYIYGLGITLILYLWPLYSFITELSNTGSIGYTFLTNNQPLIATFIVLIVTGFYFFVHNALFQPKFERIRQLLLEDFSQPDLDQALEDVQQSEIIQSSCYYRDFHAYVRSMSFIIYAITLVLEIYLYFKIVENSTQIATLAAVMGYILLFLILGAFYIYINVRPVIIMPIVAILSLGTALPSLGFYNESINFYHYAFISLSGPFIAIFWSIIKTISIKTPIYRPNVIIALYIVFFLPVIILVINSFKYFTTDTQTISSINYTIISIISLALITALIAFIVMEVRKHKIDKEDKGKVPIDYNYHEDGDPEYKYYEVKKEYGIQHLIHVDLRQIGYVTGLIFFIVSQCLAIHGLNLLRVDLASTTFYSESISQIIYSQFPNVLMFYLYTHVYLANPEGNHARNLFFILFVAIALSTLISGFIVTEGSTTLKIVGGFSIVMVLVLIALEAIKSNAQKIFGFISALIIVAIWLFIVLPYVVVIPFTSLYADQTRFGTFIYSCILGSVVLLILLVSVLTIVFNQLIDKFQEQKKQKFVMEDVVTLFHQEGVQSNDEQLHILYESFMFRDKKYVFFLKRGHPVNLVKDPDDHITKLVTAEDYQLKRIPTKKELGEEQQKKRSLLWACLTCCCGEDDEEIQEKLNQAKKVLDKEELQSLLPPEISYGLIKDKQRGPVIPKKIKKKWKNPTKVYSSKSLILKDLHSGPRYLGDEYIILKTGKNADLGIQIWHNIFDFAANTDQGQAMIIANDFQLLLENAKINLSEQEIDKVFADTASGKWGSHSGMNLYDFALAIETIAAKDYGQEEDQAKFLLLLDLFFYNLAVYEEFNSFMIEKKTKNRIKKSEIKTSPFQKSYQAYRDHLNQQKDLEQAYVRHQNKHSSNKLILQQPVKEREFKKKQVEAEKGPSCKRIIYDKVKNCQNCCKKEEEEEKQDFERKMFVTPWNIMCIQAVRIMQKKQNDWDSVVDVKEHPFRATFNNFIMAGVKFIDIFAYVSVSIMNPQIGWIENPDASNLYLSYYVQIFIAVGVVVVSVPFGIRGIMLIFEDRLGLTQNRLPATFPHPMFIFTLFYKGIVLALFNIVTQTFLVTFDCNWTSQSQPYLLVDDPSIECFSSAHNTMVIISLISLISYYPLSSYAMPNFQFAEKSLDLKYRPSYLILYFQVNFILLASKVLLSGADVAYELQIINNAIIIAVLAFLALSVLFMKPCFILWFNWVQLGVILIGLAINVMGLVLFITQQWTFCVILAGSLCLGIIIFTIIVIRRGYFSAKVNDETQVNEEQYKELQMMWNSKQKKEKYLIGFTGSRHKKKGQMIKENYSSEEENTQVVLK